MNNERIAEQQTKSFEEGSLTYEHCSVRLCEFRWDSNLLHEMSMLRSRIESGEVNAHCTSLQRVTHAPPRFQS